MRGLQDLHPAWDVVWGGIALCMRLEALLFFAAVVVLLDAPILPRTLDRHTLASIPLAHGHGRYYTVFHPSVRHLITHVVYHAPAWMRQWAALVRTLVRAAATLAHEAGQARALRRAGATDRTITIYGAGGSCRAQAREQVR